MFGTMREDLAEQVFDIYTVEYLVYLTPVLKTRIV